MTAARANTGIQEALRFLAAARRDEELRLEVERLGDLVTLNDLVLVAGQAGFRFTAHDLQRAHAFDWRLREARYFRAQGVT